MHGGCSNSPAAMAGHLPRNLSYVTFPKNAMNQSTAPAPSRALVLSRPVRQVINTAAHRIGLDAEFQARVRLESLARKLLAERMPVPDLLKTLEADHD